MPSKVLVEIKCLSLERIPRYLLIFEEIDNNYMLFPGEVWIIEDTEVFDTVPPL